MKEALIPCLTATCTPGRWSHNHNDANSPGSLEQREGSNWEDMERDRKKQSAVANEAKCEGQERKDEMRK